MAVSATARRKARRAVRITYPPSELEFPSLQPSQLRL
jgi:hypothetical protein